MRLIDADNLIEAMKKIETEYENEMACPSWWSAFNVISEQPTTYDIDKVAEELEKAKHEIASEDYCKSINDKEKCDGRNCFECCAEYLIEIVKQGGIGKDVNE